jgi:PKD domain
VGTVFPNALARSDREEAQMIGFGVLAAAIAVAAPQWSTPVQISAGDRALGPELAMNAAGDAVVVWDQEVGADCPTMPASLFCIHIVELAERPSSASAWKAPIELNRPGIGSRPRPAIDANGDAAVIWVHDIGVPRVLQATYRRGPNGEWPNPNDLSKYVLGVMNHEVVLTDDGNAYVTWREHTDSGDTARWEQRVAGIWGAANKLADNVVGGPALRVGRFTNQAETVWAEDAGVIEDTLPWDSRVAFGATPRGDPAIASKPGSIAVVFATGSAVAGALCCTLGFSTPTLIGTGADPKVAMNGPSTVAVWLGATGVQAAEGFLDNATWSPPATLSRDADASDPHVAVDANGNAVAVWLGGNGTVQAAIRPATTRLWQPAATVSETRALSPRVAIDAAGNALAVWNQASPDHIVVESSELFTSGPILQRLHVPARGRVHRRIAVSVLPSPWGTPLSGPAVWRFGDGKSATGASVAHAYARPGRYTVTVTQADASGGTASASATIRIVRRARRA